MRNFPGVGSEMVIAYLKMQLASIDKGGVLQYTGLEKTFEEELALDIDESVEIVQMTLMYLNSCGLIEVNGDKYFLPYAIENTGSEGSSAQRVRQYRERQKSLQCNTDVTACNKMKQICNGEKEIEIEIEKEIDTSSSSDKPNDGCGGSPIGQRFEEFWKAYPRKVGKKDALKSWTRLKPSEELTQTILTAVENQKHSAQWTKDGGQYIPHPATWLNQGRWDDEPIECQTERSQNFGSDSSFTADDFMMDALNRFYTEQGHEEMVRS